MTQPGGRRLARVAALVALVAAGLAGSEAPPAPQGAERSRQVTVFGIVATPDCERIDPELAEIAAPLRRLRPGHGFRLRGVESRRLSAGQALRCELGDRLTAEARLIEALNPAGKVRIQFTLRRGDRAEFTTAVTAPPNQLFFCELALGGTDRLLIGIGAR